MRPALIPRTSPNTGSVGVYRWRLERLIMRGIPEEHPVIQALAGRIHGLKLSAVPQKNANTPAAVAWERASRRTPGYMNRHHRKRIARENDAIMATLADAFNP